MSFPAYPAYKDSGIEWLGEVPEHWTVQALKRAIAKIESGTSVNAVDYPAEPGSYGVLKTSCVYAGQFDWRENKTVDDEDLNRVSCPLNINTLVVSRMNTPDLVGATGLVVEAPIGIFLPDRLWQIYFEKNQSASFIFYFTKAPEYRGQVKNACSGTSSSMQNLGQDDFRNLLFAQPPVVEQTQIARFLDHETARIDALIEEQQRLIQLLKEKRQAVISHAVTKGLDPTVPMKDSGVEWLGEVPAHWIISPLKFLGELVTGITPPSQDLDNYSDEENWPWVRPDDLKDKVLPVHASKFLTDQGWEYCRPVSPGSILVCCIGTIGKLGYLENIASTNQQITAVIPFDNAAPRFLFYILYAAKAELNETATGNVLKILNSERLGNVPVVAPPIIEQVQIATFLDQETSKLDTLLAEAGAGIELLGERRSALISAAVTGKIDVRGWQPPATTPSLESAQEAV